MADQNDVRVQQFTRVHLVPRVNKGQTVAIAFELPDLPPVAYGAPVQTFLQLFGMVPQVLSEAKKIRHEAGLVESSENSDNSRISWQVHSINPSLSERGELNLAVDLDGCQINLIFSEQQLMELSSSISLKRVSTNILKPKKSTVSAKKIMPPSAKRTQKTVDIKKEATKKTKAPIASKKKPNKSSVIEDLLVFVCILFPLARRDSFSN